MTDHRDAPGCAATETRAPAERPGRSRDLEELRRYLREIRTAPPLAREEEHALALRARAGDRAARQALVRRNLALVVAVVRTLRWGGLSLEDVVQEGNLGLIHAVEKFDPDAGTRFSTYAVWWVRAYVGKYLAEARSAVRPRSGRVAQADVSLDEEIGCGADCWVDRLADEALGPEDAAIAAQARRRVRDALGRVRGRLGRLGWDIVQTRLAQDPPSSLEAIGRRWGISRERVRQIELQTKQLLRRYLAGALDAGRPAKAA